jgi:hypothetical protein
MERGAEEEETDWGWVENLEANRLGWVCYRLQKNWTTPRKSIHQPKKKKKGQGSAAGLTLLLKQAVGYI